MEKHYLRVKSARRTAKWVSQSHMSITVLLILKLSTSTNCGMHNTNSSGNGNLYKSCISRGLSREWETLETHCYLVHE